MSAPTLPTLVNNPAADLTLADAFQLNTSVLQVETPNAGVVFTLSGNISGGPDVNLIAGNGGTVVLSGNNSFNGLVRLRSGILGITNASGVNSASAIRVEGGDRDIVILAADQLITTRFVSLVGGGALTARSHWAPTMSNSAIRCAMASPAPAIRWPS